MMQRMRGNFAANRICAAGLAFALTAACAGGVFAGTGMMETGWDAGHKSKSRLIVGALPSADGGKTLVAGLEIVMEPGWKTYWRNPGDAGGIPPYFNWSGSRNLKTARVQFPAPRRFTDETGTTIGYKKRVILPIMIEPQNPSRPVGIAVTVEFGVCLDICIPARAQLAIEVDPDRIATLPPGLARALQAVPVPSEAQDQDGLPRLASAKLSTSGPPALVFEIAYPRGTSGADLFAEAGHGLMLPVIKPLGLPTNGRARFALRLGAEVTAQQLAGKPLRLTMVSDAVSSETTFTLPR